MIKIENVEVLGWEHAIRGMRNPMNSWEKSDSDYRPILCQKCDTCPTFSDETWDDCYGCNTHKLTEEHEGFMVGPNDHQLMTSLAKGGPVHAKYRRMITVYLDITAPLYWWKEFDTYKVGTVANSCSTMHKIHAKEFELSDFSTEHLMHMDQIDLPYKSSVKFIFDFKSMMDDIIAALNNAREMYLETHDKKYWWQMIQLLPTSYNQKRTVMLNYEVLVNIYESRRHHKLDEWHTFCDWIESLPYSELITGTSDNE